MNIYSVYDHKAAAFLPPFTSKTTALAIRDFKAVANDPEHQFGKYPEDYGLFRLGTFDEDTGAITSPDQPQSLGLALEYVNQVGE